MIFSYNWLREFVELPQEPAELARVMTFGGIEVEGYHPLAEKLQKILIVKIIKVERHPAADKLQVCIIETGSGTKQVVCGAPNCRQDMVTTYAPVGETLQNRLIDRVSIRGVESEGMLCSEKDLGISDNHGGIMDLPQDATLGSNLREYLKITDTIFEVEITPNRPDQLGLLGLARDVAALTKKELQLPGEFPTDGLIYPPGFLSKITTEELPFKLTNEAPDFCSRYIAQVIAGVKITESPQWLKEKLIAIDINPINNVVDITNYVMMEFGHPLHAFDYDQLENKEVKVRLASKDERISALDHKEYSLLETDLVIADGKRPVAIAGIIGGTDTAISTETKTIVLEAANFYHLAIRKTANRLKINTDSAYRFERNLSDETVALITQRAVKLICLICGGKVMHLLDSYPSPKMIPDVPLRTLRTNQLLTTELTTQEIWEYLKPLGLIARDVANQKECAKLDPDQGVIYQIPPYRKDLTREIDLIEEVIRIHGYNNIPEKEERETLTNLKWFRTKRCIADYLVQKGFYEAINSSFTEPAILKNLNLQEDDYRYNYFELVNPLGASYSMMRTSLIPGILKNVQFNISNGQNDLKLFELGKVFLKINSQPEERYFLTGAIAGNVTPPHWKQKPEKSGIFAVKGFVEGLLPRLSEGQIVFAPYEQSYYQQEGALEISISGQKAGNLGKLDPLLAHSLDIEQPVYLFDIDISAVMVAGYERSSQFEEINKFPPVSRDISFIVNKDHSHQRITRTIRETSEEMIRRVTLIDEFTGKNIPDGYRSLTYSILFSSNKGTLTEEIIKNQLDSLRARLEQEFKIGMR